MTIHMNLGEDSYDILVERGILARAGEHLNLNRRVLVVTDSGVPAQYAQAVAAQCKDGVVCKSLEGFGKLLQAMLDYGFSRKDCVVAVGGGVVGDLAGFAASAYMRGMDFYNLPTTLLSQIDSSIGGKTAINFGGVKNIVGAFYQPKKVLIDPDLLRTLPERQIANGLAEAVKVALTSDGELFRIFEHQDVESHLDEIILRALNVKKNVVEQDEKESGLRKILNFGHTVGHAIESAALAKSPSPIASRPSHGYCVLWGMVAEVYLSVVHTGCPREVLQYLSRIMLMWYGRPECNCKQREELIQRMYQDKKNTANTTPNFTLLKKVGQPMINQHLTERDINEALEYLFSL